MFESKAIENISKASEFTNFPNDFIIYNIQKFFLSLFLVFLLTLGSFSDDHETPPGCPSNHTCPSYVTYKGYDYRVAFCSKWTPCWNSPFPTCVFSSGWQYWCFQKGIDGELYPDPVYPHLDRTFIDIQHGKEDSNDYVNPELVLSKFFYSIASTESSIFLS